MPKGYEKKSDRKAYLHKEDRYEAILRVVRDLRSKPVTFTEICEKLGYRSTSITAVRIDMKQLVKDKLLTITPISRSLSIYQLTSPVDETDSSGVKSRTSSSSNATKAQGGPNSRDAATTLYATVKNRVLQFVKWLTNKDKKA